MRARATAILIVSTAWFAISIYSNAVAQQRTETRRIGWLGGRSASSPGSGRELFRRELAKLGYVEGKNVIFDYRSADTNLDRIPAIAAALVKTKPDVLIASSASAALAAKNATRTIPIVFFGTSDPVQFGLVTSLSRPGGNVTGISDIQASLIDKRLEILKDTIPKLSRIGMLWSQQVRGYPAPPTKEQQATARGLNLTLHPMQVATADDYEDVFKTAGKIGIGAVVVIHGTLASSNRKRIAELAAKHRLPAIYPREDYVAAGGLMSYGPDEVEPYTRGAVIVDKILKGTKPADIPVEQPTKFELVINLKVAEKIGLAVPAAVLARTDRVIR